jgi:hypothetical protein
MTELESGVATERHTFRRGCEVGKIGRTMGKRVALLNSSASSDSVRLGLILVCHS